MDLCKRFIMAMLCLKLMAFLIVLLAEAFSPISLRVIRFVLFCLVLTIYIYLFLAMLIANIYFNIFVLDVGFRDLPTWLAFNQGLFCRLLVLLIQLWQAAIKCCIYYRSETVFTDLHPWVYVLHLIKLLILILDYTWSTF